MLSLPSTLSSSVSISLEIFVHQITYFVGFCSTICTNVSYEKYASVSKLNMVQYKFFYYTANNFNASGVGTAVWYYWTVICSTCVAGPLVWYQIFEYALGHWLQKATEHVLGCVLCAPGCFSLFRGSALVDDNVMRKYATQSTEARHYIQYDQGKQHNII